MVEKKVYIPCDCGCTILEFGKYKWNGQFDYSVEAYQLGFYANQRGIFSEIWNRIRAAWFMLRGKEYSLYGLSLTEENFNRLVESLVDLQNTEVEESE